MSKARSKLTLERVLGLTACNNSGLSVNHKTGDIAYPAGCVVVVYNSRRDKQTRYYRVEKTVSAVAFSLDGTLIAIAEKGHSPSITVWSVETGQLKAEFKRHKYGIVSLAFSADTQYLVSMGFVHDKMLYVWDLSTNAIAGGAIIEEKIHAVAFSNEGRFLVTVGQRHVKFWFLDANNSFRKSGNMLDHSVSELEPTAASMPRLTDATFVDVGCGTKTIAITADGFLCCFGGPVMERFVSMEASRGFALSVMPEYVAVCGASATIRLFDPVSLEYKATMPFPPPHGRVNDPNQVNYDIITPDKPQDYAAVMAIRVIHDCIVALYADHSLVIMEVATRRIVRTFFFHRGPVSAIAMVGTVVGIDDRQRIHVIPQASTTASLPDGSFVTCGDDKTVRFWHLDRHKKLPANALDMPWRNPYCPEALFILYASPGAPPHDLHDTVSDAHTPKDTTDAPDGFKCLALSRDGKRLALGSNDGNIHIVTLQWPDLPRQVLPTTHASGVLSVDYSSTGNLASGGRDRLIHVFDETSKCAKTLENHSGAVISVHFSADGKRLVSAGADHNLVFTQVSDHRIFRYNSLPVKGGKIHDMIVVANDYVVSSVNTWIDVHTLVSNKQVATHAVGEHHHIALSPEGGLIALGGSPHDKCIYVVDLHSGEVLAKAAGHGDAINGLEFTLDGRRLVSVSNDGCVFVWRLSDDLQSMIKAKLPPIQPPVEAPPAAPPVVSNTAPPPPLMPPPAPPVQPAQSKLKLTKETQQNEVKAAPIPTTDLDEWMKTRNVAHFDAPVTLLDDDKPVEESTTQPDDRRRASTELLNKALVPNWAKTFRQSNTSSEDKSPAEDARVESQEKVGEVGTNDPPRGDSSDVQIPQGAWGSQANSTDTVPEWARTKQPPKVEREPATPPMGRWATHAVVDSIALCDDEDDDDELEMSETLYIKQSNGELHEVEVPVSSRPAPPPPPPPPVTSWSLAQERDLLNKKKKQQETANAVADMQAKLGKLGLLKPRQPKTKQSVDLSAAFAAGYQQELEPSTGTGRNRSPITKDSMPEPTLLSPKLQRVSARDSFFIKEKKPFPSSKQHRVSQSFDATSVGRSLSQFVDGYKQSAPSVTQSADVPGDVSLSQYVSGYDKQETQSPKKSTPLTSQQPGLASLSLDLPLDMSLSSFVSGYDKLYTPVNPTPQIPQQQSGLASISLNLPVDMSFGQFVAGYDNKTKSQAPLSPACSLPTQISVDLPVDQSLSQFVAGHAISATSELISKPTQVAEPSIQASIDTTPVDISLVQFVSGYREVSFPQPPIAETSMQNVVQQSLDFTPINASLGQFVSGYQAVAQSAEGIPVDASLSQFTSGYTKEDSVSQSADFTPVDASLGQFVAGYNRDPIAVSRKSSSTASEPSETSSLDDTSSLSQFISGYSTSVDLAPVDDASFKETQASKATPSHSSVDSSDGSFAGSMKFSLEKKSNETIPTQVASATPSNVATTNETPERKTVVRSLRHLEVNLETTMRQLDAVRGNPEVDEIFNLAATLQQKIEEYADKAHE
ncbi:unnamed protein product [Aphanomyces euteiches]